MHKPSSNRLSDLTNPCIRNCCLDGNEVCLGCGRKLEEILRWHRIDDADRQLILQNAALRRANA